MTTDFTVRPASREELGLLLEVQRDGFGRVASGLGIDPAALPPLRESLDDLQALHDAGMRFFAAVSGEGTVVGTVRVERSGEDSEIGRLAVASGWQRRGVATALMAAAEAAYPDANRCVVFTGSDAAAPLALYAALGYTEYGREDLGYVELVWLEKRRG